MMYVRILLTMRQPLPGGRPWGDRDHNTNYYTDYPITGVNRVFDWTVTRESCAPDGVNTTCLMVNGQYPGPAIEVQLPDLTQRPSI
jgi:hypothetical protein